jgi:hypothetical protein
MLVLHYPRLLCRLPLPHLNVTPEVVAINIVAVATTTRAGITAEVGSFI